MRVIIEADGGSRGNPGVAGSGSVIYDAEHTRELKAISYAVGQATNNVAEYHGLLNGVRAAVALGATEVDIRMDSKLVVEQMSGRWKIKHPDMKQLAVQCQEILRGFTEVTFTWIPRKNNARADELANIAMDALAAGKVKAGEFVLLTQDTGGTDTNDEVASTPKGAMEAQQVEPAVKPQADTANATATVTVTEPRQHDINNNGATTGSVAGAKVVSPSSWNGAVTKPTRLLLLRHGQTEMSVKKLYSGRSNPALTEQGLWQAQRAAERIAKRAGLAAIVASPLTRCQQTAQAVADQLGMSVTTYDELIEVDFGQWEGLSFAQAHEADPQLHSQWLADPSVAPPGGESLEQANARAIKAQLKIEQDYPEQTILVVSHVTPIKAIIGRALGASAEVFHRLHLDLASFSITEFYADGPTCVRLFNDCSHLKT